MADFAQAFIEFGVKPGSLEGVVNRVKSTLEKLAGGGPAVMGDFGGGIVKSLSSAFSSAAPGLAKLLASPLVMEITAGITAALATIPLAIERETKMTRMGIQTGSMGNATQLMAGLKGTFTGTGINEESLSGPVAAMAAHGEAPAEIIAQMKELGNISIATGKSIETMAGGLERVAATGRVSSRVLFSMEPVTEQLARNWHTTTEEVYAMAENGQVRINDLRRAMHELGGETGRWGDALSRMQDTTGGQWENLTTQLKGLAADIGTSLMEAFDLKGVFETVTDVFKVLRDVWKVVNDIIPVTKLLGMIFEAILWPIRKILEALDWILKQVDEFFQEFYGTSSIKKENPMPKFQEGGGARGFQFTSFTSLAEHMQQQAASQIPAQQLAAQQQANGHLALIAENTSGLKGVADVATKW